MRDFREIFAPIDGDRHALHLTYAAYAAAIVLFTILVFMSRQL
jgi:hypothetical protein